MNSRIAPARRCSTPGHPVRVLNETVGAVRVSDRSVLYMFGLRSGVRLKHARRKIDMLANIALVGFPADDLDDPAQQDEPVVRILEARSRNKSDWPVAKELHVVRQRMCIQPAGFVLRGKDIARTTRMVEQL